MIKETEDFSTRVTERANTSIEKLRHHISFDTFFHKKQFLSYAKKTRVNHIEQSFTNFKWHVCNYKLSRTRQACVVGSMLPTRALPGGHVKGLLG